MPGPTKNYEEVATDNARIEDNQSLTNRLTHVYHATVVADDGTVYGLRIDGSDAVIDAFSDVRNDEFTEVHRFGATSPGELIAYHITAAGTHLFGVGGQLKRSTDGGSTWTDVQALSEGQGWAWSFDEDGSGNIYCIERGGDTLFTSADDGQTWASVASRTTEFSDWSDHLHKVAISPVNDRIYVTGGDNGDASDVASYYYSDDGGTTWTAVALQWQFTGVTPHHTNGSVAFFGSDGVGVGGGDGIVREDTTGDARTVASVELAPNAAGTEACHALQAVSGDDDYYIATTANLTQDFALAATDADGYNWRTIDLAGGRAADISAQGGYASVIDASTLAATAMSDVGVNLTTSPDALYGGSTETGVDRRYADDEIHFSQTDLNSTGLGYVPFGSGARTIVNVHSPAGATHDKARVYWRNGQFIYRNATTGNDIIAYNIDAELILPKVSMRFTDVGSGVQYQNREDLTAASGTLEEIRVHDGTDGTNVNAAGPAWWDDVNNQWVSLVDGGVIQ